MNSSNAGAVVWYFTKNGGVASPGMASLSAEPPRFQSDFNVLLPPPPCISYANVHNYYGPYTYCSLDKGVACAQHIQLSTHTCAGHMR